MQQRASGCRACGCSVCADWSLQLEGIAKAKAAGVYKGRPPSIEASRVRELKAKGMRPTDIAKALKIGRASVYRALGQTG
jgi:DNA invertase Pin-like site-specific DNA recombinase